MTINPGDEVPAECEQIGNFVFGLLKEEDGRVFSSDPPEDTLAGRPPTVSSREVYIERFKENRLTICEDEEIQFAHGHYPLIGFLGGRKILIWNLGYPVGGCNFIINDPDPRRILLSNHGFFTPLRDTLDAEFGEDAIQIDAVPGLAPGPAFWDPPPGWGQCPSFGLPPPFPTSPIIDYNPNTAVTSNDLTPDHWTGDINDYEAVIWYGPVSSTVAYHGFPTCVNTSYPNDARWVGSPRPLWWDQLLTEGYEGNVVLAGNGNSFFGGQQAFAFMNYYINDLCAEIGSSIRIDTTVRSWGDNPFRGDAFTLPRGGWGAHPLALNMQNVPHTNSAPVNGGTPLFLSGDARYRANWCEINTPVIFSPAIGAVEQLTRNNKSFYFIVFGTDFFEQVGTAYGANQQDLINKVQFVHNMVNIKAAQPG